VWRKLSGISKGEQKEERWEVAMATRYSKGRNNLGISGNTILHSANSYLRVHENNTAMRRGNFHLFARIPSDVDPNQVVRRISFLKRLLHTIIG
jgi:hypothetical protein